MTTSFSFDVFLSHNKNDKPRVRRLAERLRAVGVRVWFDEWVIKPGDDIYLSVERGLEAARTLVLCLSPEALGSDWVRLERSTVLFRDPSNAGRRFIPLLLMDCDLPDTLRRYKYVDLKQESEAAFEELLTACRAEEDIPTPRPQTKRKRKTKPVKQQEQLESPAEPLAILERRLTGHTGFIWGIAVSPQGDWFTTASRDHSVGIWNWESPKASRFLKYHQNEVLKVAIAGADDLVLSASMDHSIRSWRATTGELLATWKGHKSEVSSIRVTRDSLRAISGSRDKTIRIWDIETGDCLKVIEGSDAEISSIAVVGFGARVISGQVNGKIRLWDLETAKTLTVLNGHVGSVESVQVASDGRYAVSGSVDKTVKIWDLETGFCVGTLEGHQYKVLAVDISPDSTLVASAGFTDGTVRLWDWQVGKCLQVIENQSFDFPTSVAFSPAGSHLMVGTTDAAILVFRLNPQGGSPDSAGGYLLGAKTTLPAEPTRRYVNAKVVLVGESGVGKSGLANRLIEDQFIQTHSTHGMQVWRLDLPLDPEDGLEREALLWDLAGQEDYRLIHQLFLDETALALMLFNPQEDDPFGEIGVWLKVLRTAVPKGQAREMAMLLIAARTDVGSVKVSQRKIDHFLREHGFAAYLPTSAKRGDNCSDQQNGGRASALKELVAKCIPWGTLPWTSTPRLLADLKNAVIEMKEQRDIRLLRFAELVQRLEQALPKETFRLSDVRTAVTLLANHGLVMSLKFGDLVLLRPELLNGYASAVIRAARDHTDEIGCVKEQAVFDRTIDLEGVERLDLADEDLLVRAIVQTLLDKSLCIAEDTPEGRHLIFPSQYRRERPIPQHPEIFVSYTFSGEWQTVYTTLVVRLWYSREFQHRELWRNAAEFETSKGRTVGLLMERIGEGEGTISVFFETEVPDELKVIFIEYVHRHLEKYASEVHRDRRYVCPACAKPVADLETVRERIEAKKEFIYCQKCDGKVPLIDHIEQRLASDPVARRVLGMDEKATRELDAQALEQILTGHMMAICGEANQIFRELTKFDYGIDGEVEFKNNDGAASGKKIYVQLKSGASHLRTRGADGREIFDVKEPRHLEYWVSHSVDVYLVIRDAEETIRWMNVTRYLKKRLKSERDNRQIVFEGEKLDAPAVWRVRDAFFGR